MTLLKREKNENLAKTLELAKASRTSLDEANKTLQERFDCLNKMHKALEVEFDLIKNSTPISNDASSSTMASNILDCSRCKDIDIDACATNSKSMQALASQNEKLMGLLHNGLLKCHLGSKALKEYLGYQRSNFNHEGLGYYPQKGKKVETVQKGGFINFVKAKSIQNNSYAPQSSFDASYVLRKDRHGKIVARYVGIRHKHISIKQSIWVPKMLVTNLKGPKQVWVPKNRN